MLENGLISVLKPAGMSSSQVVGYIKRLLNIKKAGHCGTLDPGASGVLKVAFGRATKICDYLMDSDKIYIAEFTFGKTTDTLDSYGKITQETDAHISADMIRSVIDNFTGEIDQYPPMFSAIKVNGCPMYKLARQGQQLDLKPRKVFIKSIEVLSHKENSFNFKVTCSKGTYIRSLCRDIAASVDTVGYMSFLLREYSSGSHVTECYTLEELSSMAEINDYSFITDIRSALSKYNKVELNDYLYPIITSGSAVDLSKIRNAKDFDTKGYNVIYCKDELIGIGKVTDNIFKLTTMLFQKGIIL